MKDSEKSDEERGNEVRVSKEEKMPVWQYGFEQGILQYLRMAERTSFGSINFDGEVVSGWVNHARPLERQTVQAMKSGTAAELEQFDALVREVRNLLFDQQRREGLQRSEKIK